jgi:predicted acylesterase/phospholipase RssA
MDKEKRMLNLSGASTKISGLAGAADYIYNVIGYRPTDITGISAGSLLSVPIAMRKWETIKELTQTFKLDDIFTIKPIDENNKLTFRAKIRAITGKSSFGTQGNLYKTLAKVITPKDFKRYQEGDYPNCWVGCVDAKSGARLIANLKDKKYTYQDFLKLVVASTSIPLAVEPVPFNDMILYDGGIRNHILSAWALEEFSDSITETISIFSRPQEFHSILDRNWKDNNMLNVFERISDISIIEVSKKDEKEEQLLLELLNHDEENVKHAQIFIPSIIKELYDTDPKKLRELYKAGYESAKNKLTSW